MTGGASFWIASTRSPGYAPLDGDLSVAIAVVGGGIAGLTAAYLLKEAGAPVAVLEAGEIGAGVTGHTTGKLTAGQGLVYSHLEDAHGPEAARDYAASQSAGVELVFDLAADLEIDCDLERVTNYVFAEHEDELELLDAELQAARRAGLPVELERDLDVPFPAIAALALAEQGQLHARRFVLGLAEAVHGHRSAVYERTRVLSVDPGPPASLETGSGTVRAEHVVVATNAPITSEGLLFARALPWRAYAVAAPLNHGSPAGMWINVGSPTRSVRTAPLPDGKRLLVVVGEGHRVGQEDTPPRYDALASYLAEHFGPAEPEYRWSTQDLYSVDGLPYIGRLGGESSRVYAATGFGGWGLSNGSLAGVLLRDAILRRENEWSWLYDPGRSTLWRAPVRLLRENAVVARELLGGKLRSRRSSPEDVAPGEGEVLALDGEKVAVYRDVAGALHAVSAACTHMGCIVAWNAAEHSWDCPCHGSRFDPGGSVLQGPATRPLAPVDLRVPVESG